MDMGKKLLYDPHQLIAMEGYLVTGIPLHRQTFNAIDVETANRDQASICSIGIVHVQNNQIINSWSSLVNPEDEFDGFNIKIHGIDESMVENSPTLPELRGELRNRLRGSILASHMSFDRTAFERAMFKYHLEQLQVAWLDSARIARRVWPEQYAQRGYSLKNISQDLGIEFEHHDALEDARACALIVIKACESSGEEVEEWLQRSVEPMMSGHERESYISSEYFKKCLKRKRNIEGYLFGEKVVFTGTLSVSREEAIAMAAQAGCNVAINVNKKTNPTLLVVGANLEKSQQHRQAEELIKQGHNLRIVSERDFCAMLELDRSMEERGKAVTLATMAKFGEIIASDDGDK